MKRSASAKGKQAKGGVPMKKQKVASGVAKAADKVAPAPEKKDKLQMASPVENKDKLQNVSSALLRPCSTVGAVCDSVPFALSKLGTETFVTVS